jgi:hypothetical protein
MTSISVPAAAAASMWGLAAAFVFLITAVFIPLPTAVPFYAIGSVFLMTGVLLLARPRVWVAALSLAGGAILCGASVWDRVQNPENDTGQLAICLYGLGIAIASAMVLRRAAAPSGRPRTPDS